MPSLQDLRQQAYTPRRDGAPINIPGLDLDQANPYVQKAIGRISNSSLVSGLIDKAQELINNVENRIKKNLSFLTPLSDFITAVGEHKWIDGAEKEFFEIPDDVNFSELHAAFKSFGEKVEGYDDYVITLTSSDGDIVAIRDISEERLSFDGKYPLLIADCDDRRDISDLIICFADLNTEKLSMTDCIDTVIGRVPEESGSTLYQLMCSYPGQPNPHADTLTAAAIGIGINADLNSGVYLGSRLHPNFYSALIEKTGNLPSTIFNQPLSGRTRISFWNIAKDVLKSLTCLDYAVRLLRGLLSGDTNWVVDDENTYGTSDYLSEIRDSAVSAYQSGGAGAAIKALYDYLTIGANGLTVGKDGRLRFTDNSNYTTTVFLSGVLSAGIQITTSILSAIAAVVQPAIGLAVSAIGTVVSFIPKVLTYTADTATLCKVNQTASLSVFPYNLGNLDKTMNSLYAEVGSGVFDMKGPGVDIVCSIPASRMTAITKRVTAEMHFSLAVANCNKLDAFLADKIKIANFTSLETGTIPAVLLKEDIRAQDIVSMFTAEEPVLSQEDLNLSDEQYDTYIRTALTASIRYYGLYCLAKQGKLVNTLVCLSKVDGSKAPGFFYLLAPSSRYDPIEWIDMLSYNSSQATNDTFWSCYLAYVFNYSTMPSVTHDGYGHVNNLGAIVLDSTFDPLDTCSVCFNQRSNIESMLLDRNFSLVDVKLCNGYAVQVPQYDRSSFWVSVIIANVAVAAATAIAVVGTVYVKKKLASANSLNRAKAEQAWYAYTSDPSTENLNAYRKAVRKNNWFAKFTGGTMLNKYGYWDDASEAEESASMSSSDNSADVSVVGILRAITGSF